MKPAALLAVAVGLLSQSAFGAAFETKTMRETLPAREMERPLNMPRGWLEFGLAADVKTADGYWSENGEAVDFASASWLYTTESLAVRYGIARRGELFWTFRTHYAQLSNPDLGTDITTFGIGDPTFGYALDLFQRQAPTTDLIAYVKYKAPAANESPGNYTGQANSFTSIVLTTGTPDLTLGLRGKQQVGPAAVTLGVAYMNRFSNTVQWLVETENSQFNARIKPGNQVISDAELLLQLGPVAPYAVGTLVMRDPTRIGQTSEGLFGDRNLDEVEGSGGWSLDLKPGAIVHITRGLDLDLAVSLPMRGEDLQFFPIEDLHPTRGPTFHGAVELRY